MGDHNITATNVTNTMSITEIALTTTFTVLVIMNLIGNSLVFFVVFRHKQMRTLMNYLLVNLAVSDIMVAVFIAPQYVLRHFYKHPGGTAGDILCKLVTGGNFVWTGGAASAFTLVAIAIERYYAVAQPHLHRNITPERLRTIIIGSWVYAIIFNLPLFMVIKFEKVRDDFRCPEVWPNEELAKVYTVSAFFVLGAIPLGVMGMLYPLTIRALWKDRLRASKISDRAIIRQRKKATKMMLVVSVLYAICWLPNLILYMLSMYRPDWYVYFSDPYVVSVVLVCANSTMNPFVYSLHSSRFRNELKSLFCCEKYGHIDLLSVLQSST
ncbi:hypothetical protein QZH41_018092 [Actinostola sp. cb2023]|nr:hypothetical protein QZH41_018092 [Actinostola sp. cb2023]